MYVHADLWLKGMLQLPDPDTSVSCVTGPRHLENFDSGASQLDSELLHTDAYTLLAHLMDLYNHIMLIWAHSQEIQA